MIYYWSPIHGYGEKFKSEAELAYEREAKLAYKREQESEHQGNKDLL